MKRVLIVFILGIFLIGFVNATDYYVTSSGSGSTCSQSVPCSLSTAQTNANAGDTIYFRNTDTWTASSGKAVLVPKGGVTYDGESWGTGTRATLLGNSGISNAVIYFDNDNPTYETAVIGFNADANGASLDVISILHDGSETVNLEGAMKRIENCIVHNNGGSSGTYDYGIIIGPNNERVSNVEIIDNHVYDITRTGIANYPYSGCPSCSNSNVVIRGNEVHDTGLETSSAGHGILVKNNVVNTLVECNNAYNLGVNNGHSISIEDYVGIDPTYVTIRYNFIVDSIYIHSGVDDTSTFDIHDNPLYGGQNPPAFDPSCIQGSPECNDGTDNDGDGNTDYPNDLGCSSTTDNDETNCNDGVCEGGETTASCSSDCPSASPEHIAHWGFSEGTGSVTHDSFGFDSACTLINNPTWTTGISGQGILFDGVDDYLDCSSDGSLDITGEITLAVWVYPTGTGDSNYPRIIDKSSGTSDIASGYKLYPDSIQNYAIRSSAGGESYLSTGSIALNQWNFIALVIDGASWKVFINEAWEEWADSTLPSSVSNNFYLGNSPVGARHFQGIIDEVNVWNFALTDSEINSLYHEFDSSSSCSSGADSSGDSVVSISELLNYISAWKSGSISISELLSGISEWKNGC